MHMIDHQMTLFDPAFFLCGKVTENFAQMGPQLPVKNLPAVFGNENHGDRLRARACETCCTPEAADLTICRAQHRSAISDGIVV